MWDGASAELGATLRTLHILRAKRCAEQELGEAPRFVVADLSMPLLEEMLVDGDLVLVREQRPADLYQCVDFVAGRGVQEVDGQRLVGGAAHPDCSRNMRPNEHKFGWSADV